MPFYNIISIDGGGIRGIIPVIVIDYMENYTYEYALSQGYIEPNDKKKLKMTNFFDLFAGTSIGGIAAASLVMPSAEDPSEAAFDSTMAMSLLYSKGDLIFQEQKLSVWLKIFCIIVATPLVSAALYYAARWRYSRPDMERFIDQMQTQIDDVE